MSTSSISVVDHPNGKIAKVSGVIDGTFDLRPLLGDHEIVLFDLDGVSRITSFGVREWRTALGQINAQYLGFVKCHPSVVSQFNLVPGFACGGELISFYLPYICPECNHVHEVLLDLRGEDTSVESLTPPPVSCPACGSAMEFDDLPAVYFKYARSVPSPRPPAAASAMIDARTDGDQRRELSVKKDVEDTVTAFWLAGPLDDKRALRRLTEGVEGHVVVELSELDALTDDGLTALVGFLRAVGEAYLCRVPERFAGKIIDRLLEQKLTEVQVVSVVANMRCAACQTPVDMRIDSGRLAALLEGEPTPFARCPSCAEPLDPHALSKTTSAALDRRPLADPPEAVQVYLQNRTAALGGLAPGGTQTYTAPAKLLFGNYRILRRLGEGGMGEVLLARYVGAEKFEKLVVIKRIRREYLSNPRALQEFQQEARVTARLSHPNIVQIFDFSRFEDEYFFAMEYVNGIDLRRAMRLSADAELYWPPELCMRVISDVCAGLEAAHHYQNDDGEAVPIYHRDVSPENIIISVDGAVKLMDFGIAKAADSSVNTGSGVFKGKHAYSAPEQLDAEVTADHRTDIYAAGIVLFEMLSLRRYFGDDASLNDVYVASRQGPRRIAEVRSSVPDGLQAVFERAVATNPEERYPSVSRFRDDLEQLMKRGDYATTQDLASWIRRLKSLDDDRPREGDMTPATRPGRERGEITAVERSLTRRERTASDRPKAGDDGG